METENADSYTLRGPQPKILIVQSVVSEEIGILNERELLEKSKHFHLNNIKCGNKSH
jgi:hypothetical protein